MHLLGLVRPAALGFALVAPLATFAQSAASTAAPAGAIESTREAINQWVNLRTTISTARTAWAQEKDIAEYRIRLFEDELERLAVTIRESVEAATTAEQRRGELEAQIATIRAATTPFESRIAGYETSIRTLRPQLPKPLQDRLSPLYARLPEETGRTTIDLSNRLSTVVAIFTEIEKFNRALHLDSDTQALPSGSRAQVKVLYIGLALAYAVDDTGLIAWTGRPGPQGWQWESSDDAASAIARTIGMYERTITPPAYVALPAQID